MPLAISRLYNFVNDKNNGIPITSSRVDAELNQLVLTQNEAVIVQNTAPSSPFDGMLWVDGTNTVLKQYRNNEWVLMGPVHYGPSAMTTPQNGDIWINTTTSPFVFNYYNASIPGWVQIMDVNSTISVNPYLLAPGDIIPSAASSRTGCLLCDGSAVSRTTYANLFSAIGTAYGSGDGSTTFNIPNGKSRSPLGAGQGTNLFTISNVNTGNNQLTINSNSALYTGQAVVYASTGTDVGGLTSNTTYYVIRISATLVELATTLANAIAGIAITLTSSGSGALTLTQTLTSRNLGDIIGEETHALTVTELPPDYYGTVSALFNGGSADQTPTDSVQGGGTPHNVMQPSFVVNWFIKT